MPARIELRDGRDEDGGGLIALIGGVFEEYRGCVLDVDGEMPELRHIATSFAMANGRFWVATLGNTVVGSIGCSAGSAPDVLELRKLYVRREVRRQGLGTALCARVEKEARERACGFVELWSDTRFLDAHRLYDRLGYRRVGRTRALYDRSNTVEFYFRKPLA